jgi:hypothetical protein
MRVGLVLRLSKPCQPRLISRCTTWRISSADAARLSPLCDLCDFLFRSSFGSFLIHLDLGGHRVARRRGHEFGADRILNCFAKNSVDFNVIVAGQFPTERLLRCAKLTGAFPCPGANSPDLDEIPRHLGVICQMHPRSLTRAGQTNA